jgi:hypothetical protein
LAYRLGTDGFIGRQFLWNFILDLVKAERDLNNVHIENHIISPNLVSAMLDSMEQEGLIQKSDNGYQAVLDKILSKKVISEFFWRRADQIKIENILHHFHFSCAKTAYGSTIPSAAFNHCQKMIDDLSAEALIKKNPIENSFSWNDI